MEKIEEIQFFVESVLGSMEGNAILGLMDRSGPKGQLNRFYDFQYPEDTEKIVTFILDHRNEDCYISPLIYGDERNDSGIIRRTPENALFAASAYQDSDTCEQSNFRLRPSIHLTSSTGRYQDYWSFVTPVPAAEAADISRRVAIAHRDQGSDPSSWSANKMLRVPYTNNTRHGFPEEVEVEYSGEVYDALDVSGAYDDIEVVERPIIRLPAEVSYESDQDLPDYATALDKLPESFDLGILSKEVPDGVDRSRMRYRLLCDLFRLEVLTFEDVLSIAWHAPVSRKWKEDPRNIRGLISEALKAQTEISYEDSAAVESLADGEYIRPEDSLADREFPKILSDEERNEIAGDSNWMRRWEDWNRSKLGAVYNGPYARMNGVSILSAAFSDLGFVPRGNGPEGINIYGMGVGDSGSGKTSHLKLWKTCIDEIFAEDKMWNIGSNFSPNALHEVLLARDKKVSILNADEAHGWFKQIIGQPWTEGTLEVLAKYYDGEVPPILRTGNRELSGKTAETYFLIHFMGTMRGEMSITNVLDKSMFLSGFLPRFVWYIGEPRIMTEKSMEETQASGDSVAIGYEPMAKQWAAEFANTKKQLRAKHKRKRIPMLMERDALARMGRAKWEIVQQFRNHPQWELLDPSIVRIGNNVRRLATLLALEEASDTVTLRHTLLALEAAEEWLYGMKVMTERISDSEWKRLCDEIFSFILSKGGELKKEQVNRQFASRRGRDLAEQIAALKDQGLLKDQTREGQHWLVSRV